VSERKPAVKWGAWTSSSPSAGAGGIPVLALSVQGRPRPKPGKLQERQDCCHVTASTASARFAP